MSENRKYILDANAASKKLQRMAFEIAEQNIDEHTTLILAGIKDNGVVLAKIIAGYLEEMRAVVEQPAVFHHAEVVDPRRFIGDTDLELIADRRT